MTTNPELDLVLERIIDVSPEQVWKAWTTPEQLVKWFTPAPWKTIDAEIDLRPGGAFCTVMQSPEGEDFPAAGCFLELVENRKLVWTNAVAPGYRPANVAGQGCGDLVFTGVILMEPHGAGTKYTAIVMHADAETCQKHEGMGFHQGWGAALDQLVAMVKAG